MINDIISALYMNSFMNDDKMYKNIITHLTNEIINLKNELNNYKAFHDAIIENEIIKYKFNEYESIINNLQQEITILKNNN